MPFRSSLNNRSEGNSRSRTRGTEFGGRGRVPRNQNSTDGSTQSSVTHRSSGSNSNPESTYTTSSSSETHTGDNNRRRADTPASDGRQHQDRDNTEDDRPSDPGNRKCKLNQAIVDAISSGSLTKKLKYGYVSLGGCDISTHRSS
jgi:hypothetical protein